MPAGIVVNNAIVLVEQIEIEREKVVELVEAITTAGHRAGLWAALLDAGHPDDILPLQAKEQPGQTAPVASEDTNLYILPGGGNQQNKLSSVTNITRLIEMKIE